MFLFELVGNQKSLSFLLLISQVKIELNNKLIFELNIKIIFELRSNFWATDPTKLQYQMLILSCF